MSDAAVDDFFAKKDKNKKKGKAKFVTSDIVIPQSAAQKTAKVEKKREKIEKNDAVLVISGQTAEDDAEWVDFEDETEKDYTGLRIQTSIVKDELEEEKDNCGEETGVGGEERREGFTTGPWNKLSTLPATQPPEEEIEKTKEEPAKAYAKYVPPSRRIAQQNVTSQKGGWRQKKTAPNLESVEDFPSLGPVQDADPWEQNSVEFERVRGGGRQADDPSKRALDLQLENKFNALQAND